MSSDPRNSAGDSGGRRDAVRDRRAQLGRDGEELACQRLAALGLLVVARNWRCRLGEAAVLQARDRIRAAFANSGFDWPDRRITISLPPADLPKQGAGFDLPIAVGLLAAAGLVPVAGLARLWAVGELGLGGDLRPVRGVLAAALAARAGGAGLLLVPRGNLAEAALVPGVAVAGATSLAQVAGWLGGRGGLEAAGPARTVAPTAAGEDLAEVRGQPLARRA